MNQVVSAPGLQIPPLSTRNGNSRPERFTLNKDGEIDFSLEFAAVSQLIAHSKAPIVTVYGSARTGTNHPHFKIGLDTGAALARAGFSPLTGAGPGLMEATNRGAVEAMESGKCPDGVESLGIQIRLDTEKKMNDYLTQPGLVCKYFTPRKVGLVKNSVALVVLPGGFGSVDEIVETIKLSTRASPAMPVIFVGEFWRPFLNFIANHEEGPVRKGYIDPATFKVVHWVSEPTDVPDLINDVARERIERYHTKYESIRSGVHRDNGVDYDMALRIEENLNRCCLKLKDKCAQYPIACVAAQSEGMSEVRSILREIGKLSSLRGLPIMLPKASGSMLSFVEGFFDAGVDPDSNVRPISLELISEPSDFYGDGILRLFPGDHLLQEFLLAKATAGAVIGPGGWGSLAFAFELADLQTTNQTGDYRSALVGSSFWKPCFESLRECCYQAPGSNEGLGGWDYVSWDRLDKRVLITDDPEAALNWVIGSSKARARLARCGNIPLPVLSTLP